MKGRLGVQGLKKQVGRFSAGRNRIWYAGELGENTQYKSGREQVEVGQ